MSYEDGLWVHETSHGYFVYPEPMVRLDTPLIVALTTLHFLWGYKPSPGDVVMDIGAGAGEEALTFSREVGEHGKVICVEAHPRTYLCLQKVVQYNTLENVISIQKAVRESSSLATVIEDSDRYARNSLRSSTGIPVSATTLDAIYRELGLGRINFLKMNIEGAEHLALHGATETLKHTEVLCICCHDFLAEERRDDFFRTKNVVKKFLRQNRFRVIERVEKTLPPYVRDQVWAYNERLTKDNKPMAC